MGSQVSEERPEVALEEGTFLDKIPPPEIIPGALRVREGDDFQEGHCPFRGQRGAESPVFCSQEGYLQASGNSGLVPSQSPNSMPVLQDGVHQGGASVHSEECLANLHRLEGRVLAYPYSPSVSQVSGLLSARGDVCVSGHAVWPEYCAEDVYQANLGTSGSAPGDGNPVLCLPGRLACGGRVALRGDSTHRASGSGLDERGVHHKPREVFPSTIPVHRVVRVEMGHQISVSGVPSSQGKRSRRQTGQVCVQSNVLSKVPGVYRRLSQLGSEHRHGGSNLPEAGKLLPDTSREAFPKGCEDPNVSGVGASPGLLEEAAGSRPVAAPGLSSSVSHVSDRRVEGRMGVPYLIRSGRKGQVVVSDCSAPHQSSRDVGGSRGSQVPLSQSTAREYCVGPLGQHHGSQLPESGRLGQISSLEQVDSPYLVLDEEVALSPPGLSPPGCAQHQGRLALEEQAGSDGVVPGSELVQMVVTVDVHPPPSRLVRYDGKRKIVVVCSTSSDVWGGGCRLSPSRLEPVAVRLPVSSDPLDFEGFGETERVPRRGHPGCPVLAAPAMVLDSASRGSLPSPPSSSNIESDSQRFESLCSRLCNFQVTRLDFLREAYSGCFSGAVIDFLLSSLRDSSYRQYESVWRAFQRFCARESPLCINLDLVLRFLLFLFTDRGYQVNTIASIKSALVKPLMVGFKLDINDIACSDVLRSMWLKRPGRPFVEPQWDLDRVLDFVSSSNFNVNTSKYYLVMKCILLMGLALGMRISEFHSLLRGSRYIQFGRNDLSVTILPNATFLCKNESPLFRRSPLVLKAFLNSDGTHHTLCPVACLRQYLNATSKFKSRSLFINPVTGAVCNKGRIVYHFRKLIELAQPGTYSRFQDLRKLSSWKAFWGKMTTSRIRSRGFWRGNSALARRYLAGARPSSHPCVALGEVCL